MGKTTPTDSVYRAAILTAHDIDTISDPTRASARVAMATILERHGVKLVNSLERPITLEGAYLEIEGGEGIVVSVPGDDRPADWTQYARKCRWRQIHLIHFAPRSLSVRTVSV